MLFKNSQYLLSFFLNNILINTHTLYFDTMDALLASSSDSIFLKEVFKIFNNVKCAEKKGNIIKLILSSTGKIVGLLLIRYYMTEFSNLYTMFTPIVKACLYKSIRLDMSCKCTELYAANRFKREISENPVKNGIAIYFDLANDQGILTYLPFVHAKYISYIMDLGKKDFIAQELLTKQKTLCKTLDSKFIPKVLFPSNNYVKIDKLIDRHFTVVKMTGLASALGILIDGEPGLGKSMTADYLANKGIYGEVRIIDMTKHLTVEFSTITAKVLQDTDHNCIIVFDELDKYIDYYIRESYMKLKEEESKPIPPTKNENLSPLAASTMHEEITKKIPTMEEHRTRVKEKFLYDVLSLLETRVFPKGVIFIFCANNFDSIFNDVDMTHFTSLKDRFLSVQYERCDAEELGRYITYFNDMMQNTPIYIESDELNTIKDSIKPHITITYRKLTQLSIKVQYDIPVLIEELNNQPILSLPETTIDVNMSYINNTEEIEEEEIIACKEEPEEVEVEDEVENEEPEEVEDDEDDEEVEDDKCFEFIHDYEGCEEDYEMQYEDPDMCNACADYLYTIDASIQGYCESCQKEFDLGKQYNYKFKIWGFRVPEHVHPVSIEGIPIHYSVAPRRFEPIIKCGTEIAPVTIKTPEITHVLDKDLEKKEIVKTLRTMFTLLQKGKKSPFDLDKVFSYIMQPRVLEQIKSWEGYSNVQFRNAIIKTMTGNRQTIFNDMPHHHYYLPTLDSYIEQFNA